MFTPSSRSLDRGICPRRLPRPPRRSGSASASRTSDVKRPTARRPWRSAGRTTRGLGGKQLRQRQRYPDDDPERSSGLRGEEHGPDAPSNETNEQRAGGSSKEQRAHLMRSPGRPPERTCGGAQDAEEKEQAGNPELSQCSNERAVHFQTSCAQLLVAEI